MVNYAIHVVDVQGEHGQRKFFVQRRKLVAVDKAGPHAKLLLTIFKTGLTVHLSLRFALCGRDQRTYIGTGLGLRLTMAKPRQHKQQQVHQLRVLKVEQYLR